MKQELVKYFVILSLVFFESRVLTRGEHEIAADGYSHNTTSHDVTNYGAVGDGITDDTKAFEAAWGAACTSGLDEVSISVPSGKAFLVSRIVFQGPCKPILISFQILGTIVAPPRSKWDQAQIIADEWLFFHQVVGLEVLGYGQGLIDGKGGSWWSYGPNVRRPTALRFSHCSELRVSGLIHIDSPMNHISINECSNVRLTELHMIAPITSPNTDGIDISASTNISVHDSKMETGDDCIAINGGTSHVNITGIDCGPGHGISIGSLGKDGRYEEVEDITVSNCSFHRTHNGVRIKTWQGGSGFARRITFSNINFDATDNPVIIDQYYCPHQICTEKKSAVKVSDVKYIGLRGTSISRDATINFSCSQTVPCVDIQMDDVNIVPIDQQPPFTQCINAQVTEHSSTPALRCRNRQ
ncbi:probable polygalacturonase At3g15720 [Primulina eburnea]|uniref:probable polygalacturonase At3g15720 n=1 Tax=Primulina eburnea TaxID=1245227 RepID=UPI003C6C02FE